MAERRSTRTRRKRDDEELAPDADEELAEEEEPEDELAEDELAEDELSEDELPEDELPEDELPEDELPEDEPAMNTDEDELAEEESGQDSDGEGRAARRPSRRARSDGLTAAQVGQAALRQIAELTGKQAEGVTGVEPADDGWVVGVEVVEDRRIPSSTDILATYETELSMDGDLLSYRRVKRYSRGRGDNGDS